MEGEERKAEERRKLRKEGRKEDKIGKKDRQTDQTLLLCETQSSYPGHM